MGLIINCFFYYTCNVKKVNIVLLSIVIISVTNSFAQQIIKGDKAPPIKYTEATIADPDYGIVIFDKLNPMVGGDSIRNNSKGYVVQGWQEDYYTNGALLHKGYYVEGTLKIYKNYYDNGQLEREFKVTDLKRCVMRVYYKDGKPKADVEYFDGNPVMEQDYYNNGQLKYIEEHTKDMEYLIRMNSFGEDAKPQSLFELVDKKKKKYMKREYNENGTIKEEGPMKYSMDVLDYVKEGTWKFYDENGKLKSSDNFVNGQGGNTD